MSKKNIRNICTNVTINIDITDIYQIYQLTQLIASLAKKAEKKGIIIQTTFIDKRKQLASVGDIITNDSTITIQE
jgi:hypothetical protein